MWTLLGALLEMVGSAILDFLGYWWIRILKGDDA